MLRIHRSRINRGRGDESPLPVRFNHTVRMLMSAGETPEMREACPKSPDGVWSVFDALRSAGSGRRHSRTKPEFVSLRAFEFSISNPCDEYTAYFTAISTCWITSDDSSSFRLGRSHTRPPSASKSVPAIQFPLVSVAGAEVPFDRFLFYLELLVISFWQQPSRVTDLG